MKTLYLLAASAAIVAAAPATAAVTFKVDAANTFLNVTSNSTACLFGTCSLTPTTKSIADFTLNVGESKTFDFGSIRVSSGIGAGTADLFAQLAFLTPAGSASTGGDADYLRAGGIFTPGAVAGSLIWNDAIQTITTANNIKYSVSFGNLVGAQFGGNVATPATVTLLSVPEPATWGLMILGFGAVAGAMRTARRRTTVRFAA